MRSHVSHSRTRSASIKVSMRSSAPLPRSDEDASKWSQLFSESPAAAVSLPHHLVIMMVLPLLPLCRHHHRVLPRRLSCVMNFSNWSVGGSSPLGLVVMYRKGNITFLFLQVACMGDWIGLDGRGISTRPYLRN